MLTAVSVVAKDTSFTPYSVYLSRSSHGPGLAPASVNRPSDVTALALQAQSSARTSHSSQAKFKFHLNSQPTQPADTSLTCIQRAGPSAGLLNGNTTWMPGPTGPPTEMTRIVHRRMVCVIYHIHHLTLKLTTILMEILSIRKRIDI